MGDHERAKSEPETALMIRAIVKVQIPLFSNDPEAGALVYDKEHKFQRVQSLPADVDAEVRRCGMRAFYYAEILSGGGPWTLIRKEPEQGW